MLLRMGLLLRWGPNVITDGTFITLGSTYYTCAFYKDKNALLRLHSLCIPYVITCFLPSYGLMALVRRQLTSCIPTCLVESKEWRSTEFSLIGYRCIVGPLLFNVFINDLNFSVQLSSLRLCADDTTPYASNTDIPALELSLNKALENLSSWFASNYLSVWPSPFFLRLPSNAFPDIGSVGRIE